MQHADAKFERRDPFPHLPFDCDESDVFPSASEVIGWTVLACAFCGLCLGFLSL